MECLATATEWGKDLLEKAELKLGFIGYVRFQPEKTKGQRISRSMEQPEQNMKVGKCKTNIDLCTITFNGAIEPEYVSASLFCS